jgi:hypothetical protein
MLSYARHISCTDYRLLHSLSAMIRTMSYSNLQIAACGGPPDPGPQTRPRSALAEDDNFCVRRRLERGPCETAS